MTQAQQIINELYRRKDLPNIKSWLTIREIKQLFVDINSHYSALRSARKQVECQEMKDFSIKTGRAFKRWRIKK